MSQTIDLSKGLDDSFSTVDPDIVDRIFDNFDDHTESMIQGWKEEASWQDRDETVKYLSLKYTTKREALLDRLLPDRRCPKCSKYEPDSTKWVVDKNHSSAICRDCFSKNLAVYSKINSLFCPGYDEWELLNLIPEIFVYPTVRYKIKGRNLERIRAMLGIPKSLLASKLGVNPSIITFYEEGRIKTISREHAVICLKLFREFFIKRLKVLGYDMLDKHQTPKYQSQIEEIN